MHVVEAGNNHLSLQLGYLCVWADKSCGRLIAANINNSIIANGNSRGDGLSGIGGIDNTASKERVGRGSLLFRTASEEED